MNQPFSAQRLSTIVGATLAVALVMLTNAVALVTLTNAVALVKQASGTKKLDFKMQHT